MNNLFENRIDIVLSVIVVKMYFLRVNAAVNPYLRSSIWVTLCDTNCLYSEKRVMLKLGRRERGHFVTLIEIPVHLIRVKPGHISVA